jgi:hypothetical protein
MQRLPCRACDKGWGSEHAVTYKVWILEMLLQLAGRVPSNRLLDRSLRKAVPAASACHAWGLPGQCLLCRDAHRQPLQQAGLAQSNTTLTIRGTCLIGKSRLTSTAPSGLPSSCDPAGFWQTHRTLAPASTVYMCMQPLA